MNLIDLSLKRPVFAWVLMFSCIVFGAICMNRMGVSQLPDVDFPVLNISMNYEGAAPEVVESELIDPIEQRLLSVEGIKEMRSQASQGSGRITLEFDISKDVNIALQEAQAAISEFRLPPGVDPPIVRKENPEEEPIMIVSIYGNIELREMLNWIDSYLQDQIQFLPGVGQVSAFGFSQRNLRIWLDPKKLEAYELTINDIIDTLATQHLESAAGQFSEGERELRVRWLGEVTQVKDVENILILRRGGQLISQSNIRIKDVARVEDGLSDIRRLARYQGMQTVAIRIQKQRGTNEVEVARAVKEKLASIKDSFPEGYNYRINVDFTRATEATVKLTTEKLWMAGLITILVCFLFLGSFQAAINILFSIPTSIVGTFAVLYFSGFTLNLFTLLALTLAISIVVDDAIMLLENIVRHYRMGKSSARAASEGAKEVLPAAIAATLAVVAIFVPVVFMDGIIGKFFFQFGVTISAAVLLSLLEAVTVTPMRAATFLSNEPKIGRFETYLEHKFDTLAKFYQRVLIRTLDFKWTVLIVSTLIFLVSLALVFKVKQEFVPAQDQDIIILNAQTTPGDSLSKTEEISKLVEERMKGIAEIQGFVVSVGVGSFFVPIALTPKDTRERGHLEIMNVLRERFKDLKGVRINMRDNSARNLSAGRQNPLSISLRGPDLNILNDKAQELMKELEAEKVAVDLDTDYRQGLPELLIKPNREAMADRGVSIEAVGQTLAAAVGGLRQGRYTADGRRYDIRYKVPDELIMSADDIKNIYVRNGAGNLMSLANLVVVEEGKTTQAISRVNRSRAISVYGSLAPGQSQAAVIAKAEEIAKRILPVGYSFALEGASAGFAQAFESLYAALLIGILVAYLILAVQFNSFVHPFSVLMALPFSVTGALVALWAFNQSLNLFSFIGLIVLMGIAKKNSILLVEFTNQYRDTNEKKDVYKALVEACPVRLRPIIMTSVATVAAALPLVIGSGVGSETRMPMGLSIMGGTIFSTLLTLFVVPALYLVLSKLESKKKRLDIGL
jgi:hydrophobe/amphiphile efflux-1 (HAE1) family protein